jgi:hypothetical protein
VQTDATSTIVGLVAGLPEQIVPFTKTYAASMAIAGHLAAHVSTAMVVTGERFISDDEMVGFPEGLPLVVLHDPPGGASFAAMHNIHATSEVYDFDKESVDVDYNLDLAFGMYLKFGTKADVTPVPGMSLDTTAAELKLGAYIKASGGTRVGGGYSANSKDWSGDMLNNQAPTRAYGTQPSALKGSFKFEFTYITSTDTEHAGSNSDAFLMPALTFQISEVWVVRMQVQDKRACTINGRSDKSLSPREDLSAFWWTTANDVESRMLPTLEGAARTAKHRLACEDDPNYECCTDEDKVQGCTSSIANLKLYCDWLHDVSAPTQVARQVARSVSEGWVACYAVVDNHWKTDCEDATKPSKTHMKWEACSAVTPCTCPTKETPE